jgi:Fe2+ or Zn2+ uptake regulation protein
MDKDIIAQNVDAVKILYQYKLKVTQQRLCVLGFLIQATDPVSAKTIVTYAKRHHVDQATVYRILERFKDSSIVNQIDLKEDFAYFELKDIKDHHHVICVQCKKIQDFTGCDYKKIVNTALKQTRGFAKITSHSFELFGVCNTCV